MSEASINRTSALILDTSYDFPSDPATYSTASSAMESECGSTPDGDDGDTPNERDFEAVTPKTEEELETSMEEIKVSDSSESPEAIAGGTRHNPTDTKKRRGRPPKNPPCPSIKVTKGRSKTGCVTCRRRKKKCDETKPRCMNCQKNAVVCEGYPLMTLWKGGKQRSEESALTGPRGLEPTDGPPGIARRLSFTIPSGLPFLVDGIETEVDRRFLDHFVYDLSKVLVVHDDTSNPFRDLLLPMATQHKGLMHSLLALSGSHIIARDPSPAFNARWEHHHASAISILHADIAAANERGDPEGRLIVEDPTVASTIVQCLICISEGWTNGEYRIHMNGARNLIADQNSKNPQFLQFICEFFMYHDVSNSLTSLDRRPIILTDEEGCSLPRFIIKPAIHPDAGLLVGVLKGLFKFITKITILRDDIRARKAAGLTPVVTYEAISQAVEIDAGIRDWETGQEPQTGRWIIAQLYRQCVWVYLYRTIQASKPSERLAAAVNNGLAFLRILPDHESAQCILLLPLFLLGCAAFEKEQRPDLGIAFDNLQKYSNLGNIKPARQVVTRVWEMMDAGDASSWDWETIMADMGIDLLVT